MNRRIRVVRVFGNRDQKINRQIFVVGRQLQEDFIYAGGGEDVMQRYVRAKIFLLCRTAHELDHTLGHLV